MKSLNDGKTQKNRSQNKKVVKNCAFLKDKNHFERKEQVWNKRLNEHSSSSLLTEEQTAGKSWNAGTQWYVVIAEVAAIWIELAVFDMQLAAVHGVDRSVVELVALHLASLVVFDFVARQQPVTEKTNTVWA